MLVRIRNALRKVAGGASPELADLGPRDRELIARIRARRLTYLTDSKLRSLLETCRSIEERALPGVFIEAGCALGCVRTVSHAMANPLASLATSVEILADFMRPRAPAAIPVPRVPRR